MTEGATRDDSPSRQEGHHHAGSGRAYVISWVALLALTGLSFGFSYLPLGEVGIVVALGVAAVKALVVGLFFMHLVEARFATQMVALVSVLFVVLICLGIYADVGFRGS